MSALRLTSHEETISVHETSSEMNTENLVVPASAEVFIRRLQDVIDSSNKRAVTDKVFDLIAERAEEMREELETFKIDVLHGREKGSVLLDELFELSRALGHKNDEYVDEWGQDADRHAVHSADVAQTIRPAFREKDAYRESVRAAVIADMYALGLFEAGTVEYDDEDGKGLVPVHFMRQDLVQAMEDIGLRFDFLTLD